MSSGLRSFLGATLPRSRQAIILLLGAGLAGLWFWQTGLLRHSSPSPTSRQHFTIEISGHIPHPGFYSFWSRPTLQEVWEKAGGRGIVPNGSQVLTSGDNITIAEDGGVRVDRMAGPDLLTLGLAIDPNHATAADLEAIPGIGPVLARRIIEFRQDQGPFQDIEALLAVKGIGPGTYAKIRTYLSVCDYKFDSEGGENN